MRVSHVLCVVLAFAVGCDLTNRIGLRRALSRRLTAHAKVDVRGCVLTNDDALAPGGYRNAKGTPADLLAVQRGLGLSWCIETHYGWG